MTKELDLYEYTIEDINIDGIVAMSIVDYPAIEKNFILMNKNGKSNFEISKFDKEKNTITGPAMIPNKEIYRYDFFSGDEWNVFFSEETVKKIADEFLNKNKFNNITIDHSFNANNIRLQELWIITDPNNDKANALGFKDLPKGTLMLSYKVENPMILEMIKDGSLNGFSIEAFISSNLSKKANGELILSEIEKILNRDELSNEDKYILIQDILSKY